MKISSSKLIDLCTKSVSLVIILGCYVSMNCCENTFEKVRPEIEKKCVLIVPDHIGIGGSHSIFTVFPKDSLAVFIAGFELFASMNSSKNIKLRRMSGDDFTPNTLPMILFEKMKIDRSCLMNTLPQRIDYHTYRVNSSQFVREEFVNFINSKCHLFQDIHGKLNEKGIHREQILESVYIPNQASVCDERNDIPADGRQFFSEYVSRSKPVIFRGAARHWPAISKWSNDFFRKQTGNDTIHIKFASNGEFEGVDDIHNWQDFVSGKLRIPPQVLKQLPFPDKVVVRPASVDMTLNEFIDYLENKTSSLYNVTAYLEYTSLKEVLPQLLDDVLEPDFARELLKLVHTNVWFSDGNTLGKLHFDPFDNLLCQLSGSKEVTLYPPFNNSRLYEGHITEAQLSLDISRMKLYRNRVLESTSMVMSPVDIRNVNHTRFPLFKDAVPVKCNIDEGDILFMPSFWWHEVQSKPSNTQRRNLAVNFWYEPFLTREFPCAECQMDVNNKYLHLL